MQQNTALLVMDMQTAILGSLPSPEGILKNVANAIAKARVNNVPVIYVVVGFRPGMPEISPENKTFAASRERFGSISMDDFVKIHPALEPLPDDIVVVKRRISAFTGSDLEVILRAKNIKNLVLTGVVTSGVVLSTIREAADKDYGLTVLADCCADSDAEVNNILINKIFIRQADVLNTKDWQ